MSFDTYHDRRNAFVFYTTPLGALTDQTYTDEGNPNRDWNQIWDVRTGRFEGGWTAEIAIPFKSLRYAPGRSQTWGIQIRRGIRRKNEWTHLTVLPPASGGSQAWFRVSGSATLVGLEVPPASRNIEIKPYVSARSTTDRLASPPSPTMVMPTSAAICKYGITPNLTADFTYNTDFAQVEVDEQQVNLTRFALSFPEKRDFFLEGRGIFEFGRGVALGGGGGDSVAPTLFYSRRIGLNRGRVIPIDVGGRMSGRVGQFSIGLLDIRTGDEEVSATPVTNFAVVRVKRDILRRSNIGAIFTNRSDSVTASAPTRPTARTRRSASSRTCRLEAAISRRRPRRASTATTSVTRDGSTTTAIGTARAPSTCRSATTSTRRSGSSAATTSRAASDRRASAPGRRASTGCGSSGGRETSSTWRTAPASSKRATCAAASTSRWKRATKSGSRRRATTRCSIAPFQVAPGVFIPPGSYDFADAQARYLLGNQRRVSGELTLQHGGFYDGTLTAAGYSTARVSVTEQLSVEPAISINFIDLPSGSFTSQVLRARVDYAFSPRMFASGLLQYSSNDSLFSTNLRFRWEYRPGSEFFLVYTDERDTFPRGSPALRNRAVVAKINRLVHFDAAVQTFARDRTRSTFVGDERRTLNDERRLFVH